MVELKSPTAILGRSVRGIRESRTLELNGFSEYGLNRFVQAAPSLWEKTITQSPRMNLSTKKNFRSIDVSNSRQATLIEKSDLHRPT
jgi:hypothetical protein